MYLSKFLNVFVQISKCICPNDKMYLSKWLNIFVQIVKKKLFLSPLLNSLSTVAPQISCTNYKIYFSKLQNLFVQILFVQNFDCICKKISYCHQTFCQLLPLKSGGDEDNVNENLSQDMCVAPCHRECFQPRFRYHVCSCHGECGRDANVCQ